MEPGGFEPPCRNSQRAASTSVFGDLISTPPPGADALRGNPALESSRPPRPGRTRRTSPMSSSRTLSGVEPGTCWPESQAARANCVLAVELCTFVDAANVRRDALATRFTCPVDSGSAPVVKDRAGL